jgi:hypothetical protein
VVELAADRRLAELSFAGPIGSLLAAIASDGTPDTDGRDNLGTLRLVDALYRSMDTGESQSVAIEAAIR